MIYVFSITVKSSIENKILMVYIMTHLEMYFDVCSTVTGCNWHDNLARFDVNHCSVWHRGIFLAVAYQKLLLLIKVRGFESHLQHQLVPDITPTEPPHTQFAVAIKYGAVISKRDSVDGDCTFARHIAEVGVKR